MMGQNIWGREIEREYWIELLERIEREKELGSLYDESNN